MKQLRSLMFSSAICLGALSLALGGCITEQHDPYVGKVDKVKALQQHVDMARTYWSQQHDNQRAHLHLTKALELDPSSADAHDVLGLLYADEGEYKLAEENFLKAIANGGPKKESSMRNNFAVFLYSRGRYDEALEQLMKATADTEYVNRANAFVNLARCYMKLKRPDDAEQAFDRALRLEPRRAESWLDYAEIKVEQNEFAKGRGALANFQQLNSNQPNPKALWLGIRIERVLGNRDALASYEVALKNLFPNSVEYQAYKASKQ